MVIHLMPRSTHAQDDISSAGVAADGATLDENEVAAVRGGVAVGPELSWWTVLFVGFVGCVGMFFAHPGALFALGIWTGVGSVLLSTRLVVRSQKLGARQLRHSLLLLLGGWLVVLGGWAALNLIPALNSVRDFNWHELMTMNQAMGQALTLSTIITKAHWVLGVAVLWGFYRLLNVPRLRWLLMSHVYLVFLYMLCAGSSSWLARELTGFWYNDAPTDRCVDPDDRGAVGRAWYHQCGRCPGPLCGQGLGGRLQSSAPPAPGTGNRLPGLVGLSRSHLPQPGHRSRDEGPS